MKAILLTRHGRPEVLRVSDVPDPEPGPGEVRIRVEAIGLNFAEVLSRKGLYGWAPKRPYVLGMEAAGRIDTVGAGVDDHAVGDQVVVGQQHGAYAEYVVVAADQALPALPAYSVEENAAFGVNYVTAWVSLMEMARLRPSDRVVVSAAAGGVGSAAVQLADHFGCEVIALAGSSRKLALARDLRADHTVNYREPGWTTRLREVAGDRGVDVVLESVGGDVFKACDSVLAPFGRIVVVGYASLDYTLWNPRSWWRAWRGIPRMGLEAMYQGSKGLLSTHLGYLIPDSDRMHRVWNDVVEFVTEHGIRPVVGHVLPMADVAEAHRLMESRESTGKIVLSV